MASQPVARMTEEEYLALERKAEYRSEYIDGEVYAMAGASWKHDQIVQDLGLSLRSKLRGTRCRTFGDNVRVRIPQTRMYTYPDLGIVCGPPQFADDQKGTLVNPIVLIEVLSDSTRNYDQGDKFAHYRRLESLREYVMLEQDAPHVEHYTRQADGSWLLREYDGLDARVTLASAGCELALAEIYENLEPPTA